MESKSTIDIDFSDNPELASIFASSKPGDTVTLEVEFLIKETTDKSATGAIKSVCECGMEDEEDEVEPDENSPVMLVIKGK